MAETRKKKESQRRTKLLKNIPTSKTFKEACVKSGYSPKSNYIYSIKEDIARDLVAQGYSKQACQAEFKRILDKCEQAGDYSNVLRALEAISKIAGHFKDTTSQIAVFNLTSKDQEDALKVIQGEVLDSD
jgi:hypothetical protein